MGPVKPVPTGLRDAGNKLDLPTAQVNLAATGAVVCAFSSSAAGGSRSTRRYWLPFIAPLRVSAISDRPVSNTVSRVRFARELVVVEKRELRQTAELYKLTYNLAMLLDSSLPWRRRMRYPILMGRQGCIAQIPPLPAALAAS